jgi:hypothetical protein
MRIMSALTRPDNRYGVHAMWSKRTKWHLIGELEWAYEALAVAWAKREIARYRDLAKHARRVETAIDRLKFGRIR